jgi:rhamnosyltransferase
MPIPEDQTIVAVVVTYQPELDTLSRLLRALVPQVSLTVVVDNGSAADLGQWLPRDLHGAVVVIPLDDNRGIASAQNVGIAKAKEEGADHVILFDQDSLPHQAMVGELLSAAENLRRHGERLACVGPRYLDPRHDNPPPFLRVQGLRLKRLTCRGASVVPVDYLVSSGCLIPVDVIDRVGPMREDLFIDYVDIEWGLRAKRLGYRSFGVCTALMTHSLGEEPARFFRRRVPVHTPLRHYYHFRNAILLYRIAWVPLNWKLVDGSRLILRYCFYALMTKPRAAHWWMMTLGIWHGLRNKAGRFR